KQTLSYLLSSSGEQDRTAVRQLADMNPDKKTIQKRLKQQKQTLSYLLSSSGEQDRTADLRVMNPAL
ncbi:hypothetical protein ACR79T_12395, partial [Sphingobacterium spiritivorum]|uniref:hypothetical protein n=1 Tax=Sphingobacterium spiritivorum TaxID=258 RepID=UPI003DA6C0A2